MIPKTFNVKNLFNVKGKNLGIKSVNISTIKSRIIMTLSIQENISQPHPTRMVYNFSQLSLSVVETRTLSHYHSCFASLFDRMRWDAPTPRKPPYL